MKNRFPFTCGICIRPSRSCQIDDLEIVEYLQKILAREGFLFFWSLPRNIHIPGSEERSKLYQGKYVLPHALLRIDEIKEELLFSNEKSSKRFLKPVFPPCPAPFRTSLKDLYLKRGRLFLEDRESLYYIDSRRRGRLPLLRVDGTEHYPFLKRHMKKLRRLGQADEAPVIIILEAGTKAAAETAVLHLVKLRKKIRFDLLELEDILKTAGTPKPSGMKTEELLLSHNPDTALPSDPWSRYRREIAWDKPKETRFLLLGRALGPDTDEEKQECGTFPVPERGMIAHMPGEVEMEEGDIAAFFRHGELTGLSKSGTAGTIHSSSTSWIATSEKLVRSRSLGSFSFQNSSIRGLRDSSIFESEEFTEQGRLVRDYFFTAGDPRLCISFFLYFPRCRPGVEIRSYGVCEIPIKIDGKFPGVEVHYPDEGASPVPVDSSSGGLLHGTAFSFKNESSVLSLVFADHQTKVRELPFYIRDGILRINPGGAYRGFPGSKIEGLRERFSIVLSLDALSPGNPPLQSLAPLLPHLESHQLCRKPQTHKTIDSG